MTELSTIEILQRATKAEAALDHIGDTLERDSDAATLGVLVAAVDHIAGIFDFNGDDNIPDATAKAVDKLAIVAAEIGNLALAAEEGKPKSVAELLDPTVEYARLLRDAEDAIAKNDDPARVEARLHVADRYLSAALHEAYARQRDTKKAPATTALDANIAWAREEAIRNGNGDAVRTRPIRDEEGIVIPRHITDEILALVAIVPADPHGVAVAERIRQAATLAAANVPGDAVNALAAMCSRGKITQQDVTAFAIALKTHADDDAYRAARLTTVLDNLPEPDPTALAEANRTGDDPTKADR